MKTVSDLQKLTHKQSILNKGPKIRTLAIYHCKFRQTWSRRLAAQAAGGLLVGKSEGLHGETLHQPREQTSQTGPNSNCTSFHVRLK